MRAPQLYEMRNLTKDPATAQLMPTVKIGGVRVPRVILGHLPFVGESYQGKAKNTEYSKRFSDIKNIVAILTKALGQGVTVASAPTPTEGEPARRFLEAIEETSQDIGLGLALIVCLRIPLLVGGNQIDDYRRWLTYYQLERAYGEEEILRRYLSDPVLQAREDWKSKLLERLRDPRPYSEEFAKIEVDYSKIESALIRLRSMNVLFVELGSETDLLVIGNRLDLLENLVNWLSDKYRYRCLLGSHHAGITIPILETSKINFHGYVTPVNKLGVMMFPTQEVCEVAIRKSEKPVVAIKPFAGGRIPPKPALEYVYRDVAASSCMIGVGSEGEFAQDFSAAVQIFSRQVL